MNKKINVRFIMLLVATVALVGTAVYAVHAYQSRQYASYFFDRANQAEQRGEIGEALRALGHYLTLRPDDIDAQIRLGTVMADNGSNYTAFTTLEKALRRVDDDPARRKLVEVLIRLKRFRDARAHLESELLPRYPNDAMLLDQLAQCQLVAKEWGAAKKSLASAIQQDPHQIVSYLRMLGLLDQYPEVVKTDQNAVTKDSSYWRDQLVKENPDAVVAYMSRARFSLGSAYALQNSPQSDMEKVRTRTTALLGGAVDDAGKALERVRETNADLASIQKMLIAENESVDGAERLTRVSARLAGIQNVHQLVQYLGKVLANSKNGELAASPLADLVAIGRRTELETLALKANGHLALALIGGQTADPAELEAARQLCRQALQIDPKAESFYFTLAEIEMAGSNREVAMQCLSEGADAVGKQTNLRVNLARLQVESGKIEEAQRTVAEMSRQGYPAPLVEYLEARLDLANGDWTASEQKLIEVRNQALASPELGKEIEFWLGQCYQRQPEKEDLEVAAYRRALQIDPNYRAARLALAETLSRLGKYDESVEQFRAAVGVSPDVALKVLRAEILQMRYAAPSEQHWTKLDAQLQEMAGTLPDNRDLPVMRAEVAAAQGQLDDAKSFLEDARSKYPDDVGLLFALVELAQQREDYAEADRLLANASPEQQGSVEMRIARAHLATRKNLENTKDELRQISTSADDLSEDHRLTLWRTLIPLCASCGDAEHALELARKVAREKSGEIEPLVQLLAVAVEKDDKQLADLVSSQIKEVEGVESGPVWNYCMAATLGAEVEELGDEDTLKKALSHITKTLADRPEWVQAILLAASLEVKAGRIEAGLAHYLTALQSGAVGTGTKRETIRLLCTQGRFREADEILNRMERQYDGLSPDLRRLRMQVSGGLGELEAALVAAKSVAKTSDNYADHLWLAQLCGVLASKKRQSGQTAEANDLAREAEQSAQRARELAPDTLASWRASLQLLAIGGRTDEVETLLNQARTKFTETPGGMATLCLAANKMDEAAEFFRADLVRWPNDVNLVQEAAEFCMRTGRPQLATDSLKKIVLGTIPASERELVTCRRLLALALREEGGYTNLNLALGMVQENLKANPTSVMDLRTKAMLLADSPERAKRQEAYAILEELIRSGAPGLDETRVRLLQMYLADGEWDKAVPHLRETNEVTSVASFVEGLIQRKQWEEAESQLAKLIRLAADPLVVLLLRAEMLFGKGDYDQLLGRGVVPGIFDLLLTDDSEKESDPRWLAGAANSLERFASQVDTSSHGRLAVEFRDKAEKLLRRWASIGADGKLGLAAFLARTGRFEEALQSLTPPPEAGDLAAVVRVLGEMVSGIGGPGSDADRLQQCIEQTMERRGRTVELLATAAELYGRRREFHRVEEIYREMLQVLPESPVVKNNLATLLVQNADETEEPRRDVNLSEAMALIQDAIASAGPVAAMLDTRGQVFLAQKRLPEAIDDFAHAVEEQPTARRLFHLALAYLENGDRQLASAALERAQSLGLREEVVEPLERAKFRRLEGELRGDNRAN